MLGINSDVLMVSAGHARVYTHVYTHARTLSCEPEALVFMQYFPGKYGTNSVQWQNNFPSLLIQFGSLAYDCF